MISGSSEAARSLRLSDMPFETAGFAGAVVQLDGTDEDSTRQIIARDVLDAVLDHPLLFHSTLVTSFCGINTDDLADLRGA